MWAYAVATFTGAVLLFEVEPLAGKYVLPWFGGAPSVWTTCLMFFQVSLLAGYAYAHLLSKLAPRRQVIFHGLVLCGALAFLPIIPSATWKSQTDGDPTFRILLMLVANWGVPYFVLSATSPLLQHWLVRTLTNASPYRLYALSNAGSLLALLSYPFLVEPRFTRQTQAHVWGWGLGVYALCCFWCMTGLWRQRRRRGATISINESSSRTEVGMASSPLPLSSGGGEGNDSTRLAGSRGKSANLFKPSSTRPSPQEEERGTPFEASSPRPSPPKEERETAFETCSPRSTPPKEEREANKPSATGSSAVGPPGLLDRVLWVLLPGTASVLLSATTNRMCQDVAPIPFLWVMPLAVYLLSFIVCFDHPRWYSRQLFTLAFVISTIGVCWVMFNASEVGIWVQLVIYLTGLFFSCMVCHGELYRRRPDPSHLTEFYLLMAAGGALGGFFVAVVAPLIFNDYYEFHWGLWLCALLFVVALATETSGLKWDSRSSSFPGGGKVGLAELVLPGGKEWRWVGCVLAVLGLLLFDRFFANFGQEVGEVRNTTFSVLRWVLWGLVAFLVVSSIAGGQFQRFRHWRSVVLGCLMVGLAGLATTLWLQALKSGGGVVSISRNFYGVLTVYEREAQDPKQHHIVMRHGRTTHGLQFVDGEEARWPTAYYGESSGVGRAMRALPPQPARIGVVGLGAGTLATYCRPGDYLRIYEINPEVERLARLTFTYLTNCAGKVELVSGDARLSLEKERGQEFDVLVLDAFSSDAIPVHLLTREAFEVYGRHLKTNGVIAMHISNYYLNLEPLVREIAGQFHFRLALLRDEAPEVAWVFPSTWALLARGNCFLDSTAILPRTEQTTSSVRLWTDDFASLFHMLRWKPELPPP
jgi:hypothetical protein